MTMTRNNKCLGLTSGLPLVDHVDVPTSVTVLGVVDERPTDVTRPNLERTSAELAGARALNLRNHHADDCLRIRPTNTERNHVAADV